MTCVLCSLLLFIQSADTSAQPSQDLALHELGAIIRPVLTGYRAEVEVVVRGAVQQGRLIVTAEGCIHVEQLDEETCRWVLTVVSQQAPSVNGWNQRPLREGPTQCVWGRVGQHAVLTEVHTPKATLTISRHQLFPNR
ncbi:MAG: hypothetical protein U0792_12835 [Gemmataceae bacterium]